MNGLATYRIKGSLGDIPIYEEHINSQQRTS